MICHLFEPPVYLFFASDLPRLLYYSHLPVGLAALFLGIFVLVNNPSKLINQTLFAIASLFSVWVFLNLLTWTNVQSETLLLTWVIMNIVKALISVVSVYFIYLFLTKKEPNLLIKAILFVLVLPVMALAASKLYLTGFNITDCDAFDYENNLFVLYGAFLGLLAVLWILFLVIKHYKLASPYFKKQILLIGIGIELFLSIFFFVVYLAGFLTTQEILPDSGFEQYGLFGMLIFIVVIGVAMVKFKTFNVNLLSGQALIIALIALIGAQFTFIETKQAIYLNTIALVLTGFIGVYLIRSIRNEKQQREDIESLAHNLRLANARLQELDKAKSEFVSVASHQLRSPLTAIRGYASMLGEGSFGKLPPKATEAVGRIEESSRLMALSVEDYLNVSRIQAGKMKYEMGDFNVCEITASIVDGLRGQATRKGLLLTMKSKVDMKCVAHADVGKVNQILHNLIDNALKYTKKGSVEVVLKDQVEHIAIIISDTGVGLSKEEIGLVFEKFQRAHNANSINATGTGLGLYIARKMALDMGGDVVASSPGPQLGSTFVFTIPKG